MTYFYVELLQFLLLARSSRRSFFTKGAMRSTLSGTDVIQTKSLENLNFVVIFELLPIDKEWKSSEITHCRSWASWGFNDRNATLEVDFFPASTTLHSNSNSSTVFCFTEQNSNSVSFSKSQCWRLLKLWLTRFSSEVDVVRRSCPSKVSSSPLLVRFSIEWFFEHFWCKNNIFEMELLSRIIYKFPCSPPASPWCFWRTVAIKWPR